MSEGRREVRFLPRRARLLELEEQLVLRRRSDRLTVLYELVTELVTARPELLDTLLKLVDSASRSLYGQPLVLTREKLPLWRLDQLVSVVASEVASWASHLSRLEAFDRVDQEEFYRSVVRRVLEEAFEQLLLQVRYVV